MTDSPSLAQPIVERWSSPLEAADAFQRLCHLPGCLFLDSALPDRTLGRYSFLAADPFETLSVAADGSEALEQLAPRLARYPATTVPGLPPFQGGAAGLLAYDLAPTLERIPRAAFDEFHVPALAMGLYDLVVAYDHASKDCWLISQGFPETDPERRQRRAVRRLGELKRWLDQPVSDLAGLSSAEEVLAATDLAPQFPVDGPARLTSNLSADLYREMIRQGVEYIYAGDIFQVNLAQRLLFPAQDSSPALYLRLRERNPAPFAAYFDAGDHQVVSASPERLVQLREGQVEARPIKGTRQRSAQPEADLYAAEELQQSEKDRAENVMIVDLLRNDLSRVCRPDSVHVSELCRLEVYQYVQHLVSVVRGQLRESLGPLDLVRAAFPGGSITGAPKVRAMEIIAELEPTVRGPYCGSLGYLGFDGSMDLSILIRTITAGRGWWQLPVGGGIVAQSTPEREYQETWHKARGMIQALQ